MRPKSLCEPRIGRRASVLKALPAVNMHAARGHFLVQSTCRNSTGEAEAQEAVTCAGTTRYLLRDL